MFSGKYSKSYKTVEGAEKAIAKFEAKYKETIRFEYKEMAMSWLITVDAEDYSRVIPVCSNPKSSSIMHMCINSGHPVTGTIG